MLKGVGVSEGIGIGTAIVLSDNNFDMSKRKVDNKHNEKIRLKKSIDKLTSILKDKAALAAAEQAEILQSHIMLINDPFMISEIDSLIDTEECNCEYAASTVINTYVDMFLSSGDDLLEARSSDLKDIKNNLLATLTGAELFDVSSLPSGSVIVAEELTTSIASGIDPERICAIITKAGGKTSHMAIIARSLGIPAVVGIDVNNAIHGGDYVIVDGGTGEVRISPSSEQIEEYEIEQERQKSIKLALEKYRGLPSITSDGKKIELCANIGLEFDISIAKKSDAEGVGLFRTEFLYMDRTAQPSEEEQFSIYKKAALAFDGKPIIIRTLDIGGDKDIPYLKMDKEENPFLGWRAIRYCLDMPEVFIVQLRAILRASVFGDIKIMIPMISCTDELVKCRNLIERIKSELDEQDIPFNNDIQVGIMVETPAAALMADQFAKIADFFSIGTNDLIQYTIAVDRGNEKVSSLYSAYNPAVLRLIYNVAQAAEKQGIMCGVCGESGGDPLMVKFLIGSGVTELSMNGKSILKAREIVRGCSYKSLNKQITANLTNLCDTKSAVEFLKSL